MARAAEAMQQAAPETATQLRSASDAASSAPDFQLTFTARRGIGLAARPASAAAAEVCMLAQVDLVQLGRCRDTASGAAPLCPCISAGTTTPETQLPQG